MRTATTQQIKPSFGFFGFEDSYSSTFERKSQNFTTLGRGINNQHAWRVLDTSSNGHSGSGGRHKAGLARQREPGSEHPCSLILRPSPYILHGGR